MSKQLKFIDMFAGIGGFRSGMIQAGMKPVGYIEWNKFARKCYEAMYDTTNEFTASDIQKVKGTDLPDADLWSFGSPCFTKDAVVQTKQGAKTINKITTNDYVLSIDGEFHQVVDTMRHFTKKLYKLKVDHHAALYVTGNHPILVSHKKSSRWQKPIFKRVDGLTTTDYAFMATKGIDATEKYRNPLFWHAITEVKELQLEKPVQVYNLEVEGTHTYNVNGIICKNCTDISVAGRQEGLVKGKQSSMFFEVIRLAKERIKAKKSLPRYLWLENVKNLLSSNRGRDFARVLIEMDKIGYDVEWSVIDSACFVPQHRERIYVIGHLREDGKCSKQIFPLGRENTDFAQTSKIKVVGNDSKTGYRSHDIVDETGISKTIDATSYKHKPLVRVKQLGNYRLTKSFGGNPQTGRVYDKQGLSPTLNTMQGGDRQPKILDTIKVRPTLTPERVNKRQMGRRFKQDGEPSFTLTAEDRHGVMLEDDTQEPTKYVIRKLTPRECWRLQGFTDEQFDKAKNAGVSDSQLYARAGNAVTVPVIKAIADKIIENEK